MTTNPAGRKTTFAYDAGNHLIAVTNPLGRTTSYVYDSVDRRLSSSETGSVVEYVYDPAQRLVSSSDGASYSYGANGNLELVLGSGATITMLYDVENRLRRYEDGSTSVPFPLPWLTNGLSSPSLASEGM